MTNGNVFYHSGNKAGQTLDQAKYIAKLAQEFTSVTITAVPAPEVKALSVARHALKALMLFTEGTGNHKYIKMSLDEIDKILGIKK